MSNFDQKRTRGIGLLELMLSLAIISLLLVFATRYYQNADFAFKADQTVKTYATIKSAVVLAHARRTDAMAGDALVLAHLAFRGVARGCGVLELSAARAACGK